jgi:hypothetical protein
LKRTRCRENGFVEGKKWFQLCFVTLSLDQMQPDRAWLNSTADLGIH